MFISYVCDNIRKLIFEYDARVGILEELCHEYSKVLSLPKVLGHLRFQEQI